MLERIEQGLSPRTTNVDISALRLFYCDAMGQPDKVTGLHFRRVPDRLPRSIPEADVATLIQGITDLRYRTAALTAYGAGLRISEVVALQVSDIKGADGLLRIGAGKGGHERMAFLPIEVLEALRGYWKSHPAASRQLGVLPVQPGPADHSRQPAQGLQREPRSNRARSRHHVSYAASCGSHPPA